MEKMSKNIQGISYIESNGGLFYYQLEDNVFKLSDEAKALLELSKSKISKKKFLKLFLNKHDELSEFFNCHSGSSIKSISIEGIKFQGESNNLVFLEVQGCKFPELGVIQGVINRVVERVSASNAFHEVTSDTVFTLFRSKDLEMISIEGGHRTIFDYESSEFQEKDFWFDKIHPDFLEDFTNELLAVSPKNPTKVIQFKFRYKCGEFHWVQSRLTHTYRSGEDVSYIEMVSYDIEAYQNAINSITEENQFNKQLIQHLSHVFFLINKEGKFIRWNKRLNDVSGFTDAEIATMTPMDFFRQDSQAALGVLIKKVFEEGRVETESVFVSKNGETKPVLLIGSPIMYNNEMCLSGVGIDISSQKQLIEEQRLLKEKLELTLNSSLDIICTLDTSFKIQSMNKAVESIVGYSSTDSVGLSILDLLFEHNQQTAFEAFSNVLSEGAFPQFELCCRSRNNEPVYLLWSVNWSQEEQLLYCSAKDITEFKKTQKELRASEELFRILVQDGSDMIAIVDGEGHFSYVSSNYTKILGYSQEQLLGKSGFEFMHPEDVDRIEEEFSKVVRLGRFESSPYRFKTERGEYRWMRSIGSYTKINDVPSIIINSTDISNIIEVQESLNDKNLWYEQVNRLTADALYEWTISNDSLVWNPEFSQKFGFQKEDFDTGEKYDSLIYFHDVELYKSRLAEFLNDKGADKWSANYRAVNVSGRILYVEEIGYVVRDARGKALKMIGVLRDVTEQKVDEIKNSILLEAGEIFQNEAPMKEILDRICHYAAEKSKAKCVEVWLNSEESDFTSLHSYYVDDEIKGLYLDSISQHNVFIKGQGLPGTVWQKKNVTVWKDLKNNTRFVRTSFVKESAIEIGIAAPLMVSGECIGQFVLFYGSSNESILDFKDFIGELSQRWGAEIYRKRKEEEMKLLFESSPDIIAIAGSSGRFIKVNPAFCELLGYAQEELISQPFTNFMHPDDEQATLKEYRETVTGERNSKGYINRYRVKTGGYKYISWSSSDTFGADKLLFAYGRDVTELMELQRLLEDATDLAKVGGWEIEIKSKRILWSDKLETLLRRPVGNRLNELLALVDSNYKSKLESNFINCLKKGAPFDMEILVDFPGSKHWMRIIGEAEMIDGKVQRVYGSFQDIHDRKEMELTLQTLNRDLLQKMKDLEQVNSELEQFAFIASHDLQEPLRMVTGFLTLLEKRYGEALDEKAKSYIDFAVDGSQRMRAIILDLLEFSRAGRLEQSDIREVNLTDIVNDVITMLNTSIKDANAKIVFSQLPAVQASPSQMRQVFQNLLSNAIKYRESGRIPEIHVGYEVVNGIQELYVRDNGIGIDRNYHDKIFEIFSRLHTKEEYGGTGIGLAITKKIVESMNWKIYVQSEKGKGTEFRIQLN